MPDADLKGRDSEQDSAMKRINRSRQVMDYGLAAFAGLVIAYFGIVHSKLLVEEEYSLSGTTMTVGFLIGLLVAMVVYFARKARMQTLEAEAAKQEIEEQIHQRERTEEALKESQEYAGVIIDNSLDMIIAVDREQRIIEFNKAAQKTFGYRPEEVLGKHINILFADSQQGGEDDQSALEKCQGGVEVLSRRKNGESFPCFLSSSLLINGRKETIGFLGISRDITDRKRAEDEIQCNLKRIRALYETETAIASSLDLQVVLDLLLEKIDMHLPCSAATVRLLNRETGELEPVACRKLSEKEWKDAMSGEEGGIPHVVLKRQSHWVVSNVQTDPCTQDSEFFRKNGLISYLGVPLIANSEILGVVGFYTKEIHQFANEEVEFLTTLAGQAATAIQHSWLYEEIKASKQELENALHVKSAFLDTMSHELRTPLNVIMGNAGMIKDGFVGEVNAEQERRLGTIERSSVELLGLIQGILDISRLEKGIIPLHLEEFDAEELLSEVHSDFLDLPRKEGVILETQGNGLTGSMVSDRMKLKEILYNLTSNGVKFTQKGKVQIKVQAFENGKRIEFIVQDTGIGIKDKDLENIFDDFYQVDSSNHREFGGAGLGLNIVKKLVELLGGEIRVESEFGKGSTFHVILPREISPLYDA